MRKVVAAEFLSLDGVMGSPDKWHFPYFDDEMGQAVGESFAAADAMLIDDPSDIGGKRQSPFEEGEEQTKLELVDSKAFSTGVLYLHLPAGARLNLLEGRAGPPLCSVHPTS